MKESKTPAELQAMIMVEAAKHPECRAMGSVTVTPNEGGSWSHSFIRSGGGPWTPACEEQIGAFVADLRAQYDARAS